MAAFKVWEPSSKSKGLPFGEYLHSAPPKRHRTLTGPLDVTQDSFWHRLQALSMTEPDQSNYLQPQSCFVSKLPLDIRLIIYELVLGGMTLHMTTNESKSRVLCHVCKRPEHIGDEDHYACFARADRRPSSAPREDYLQASGFLPLLLTCRRVYSEAVETLYSANTFEFWENRVAFRFLKQMIPPQRLRCIRRFRWDMQIPHHPLVNARSQRDWSDLFEFFANETCGLQHLYLKLKKNHPMEAEIEQTEDHKARGWIEPMITMAVNAHRKRGCNVEIVTKGVVHKPVEIFEAVSGNGAFITYDDRLGAACEELHRRIRLSLDAPG